MHCNMNSCHVCLDSPDPLGSRSERLSRWFDIIPTDHSGCSCGGRAHPLPPAGFSGQENYERFWSLTRPADQNPRFHGWNGRRLFEILGQPSQAAQDPSPLAPTLSKSSRIPHSPSRNPWSGTFPLSPVVSGLTVRSSPALASEPQVHL